MGSGVGLRWRFRRRDRLLLSFIDQLRGWMASNNIPIGQMIVQITQ